MPKGKATSAPPVKGKKSKGQGKTAVKKAQTDQKKNNDFQQISKFETQVQIRADPRMGRNGFTERLDSTTQLKALVQPVPLQQTLIEDWARGFVMKAVEKGLQSYKDPGTPYYAYVYIVNTLIALITNQEQLSIKVPYCLLVVARGLQSKSATCGNGRVSYATTVETYTQPDVSKIVGYQPYGNLWMLGEPGTPFINFDWPTCDNSIAGYTSELGSQAFQELCQFLIGDDKGGPARSVGVSSKTHMDDDVSMFSFTGRSDELIGLASGGSTQPCGIAYPLNLEVPIKKPVFGAFCASADIANTGSSQNGLTRYGNLHANACGDGTFLAAGQLTWFTEERKAMQRPPKLHFVDFNEFADVVAKWVSGMQQAFFDDPEHQGADPGLVQCPLTLQEMCLTLRNVLMTAFKDTQAGVHALYPVVPLSDVVSEFVPFIVSTNTCFLAPTDMRLPTPIIENIRALIGRFIHRRGDDWEVFIPVLGQFQFNRLNEDDYHYTVPGTEDLQPSFFPAALIGKKRVVTKTGESFVPFVEAQISYIDGSATSGYACINDTKALKGCTDTWELWLSESGLQTYTVGLGILGTEAGINALVSVNMTRILALQGATKTKIDEKVKSNEGLIDTRVKLRAKRHMTAQIYADKSVLLDAGQSKILATAYEEIQSVWILPVVRCNVTPPNTLTPLRIQAIADEPFSEIVTSPTTAFDLDTLHSSYAAKCVRSKLGPKTEWEKLFDTLAARGRGGILSGLVGRFADMIIPGAGSVVESIGGAIGI